MELSEDRLLLMLYTVWSEERYAATFIDPDTSTVQKFRAWLADEFWEELGRSTLEDYEVAMLREYRAQEAAAQAAPVQP